MAQVSDIHNTQKSIEESLAKRMADFEDQLKAASPSTDTLSNLREEFHRFRDIVWKVLSALRHQVELCSSNVDAMETRSRRKVLLFTGVAEESNEDITSVIINIIHSKLALSNISSADVKRCHRLGVKNSDRPRGILVRFCDSKTKVAVWMKKSQLKGSPVTISEFLTKLRQSIFMKARNHFGMKNCWTLDSVINIKPLGNERFKIITMEELDSLITRFPKSPSAVLPSVSAAVRSRSRATSSQRTAIPPRKKGGKH